MKYQIGDKFIAKGNYLDIIMPSMEYEIYKIEDNMAYLKSIPTGYKISDWGFRDFELEINFGEIKD